MQLKLRLSHKGLLLVAIPLVFELLFVGTLFVLLERAENTVEREVRSREIISTSNDMSKSLLDCAYALIGWNYTKGPMFASQFEQCYKSIPQGMTTLKDLCKNSKRQMAHYVKLEKACKTVLAELDQQKKNIESSEQQVYGMDFGSYRKKLTDVFAPFISELKEFSKEEKLASKDAPKASKQSREQLRQALLAGIALNILLAVGLAAYFSKEIGMRLGIMAENAQKFAEKKRLSAPVGGSDEVAELDKHFHDMAAALIAADQQKQEFVAMISHDLRTPLNSIQGTLELLLRGSYGELTERGERRVSDAEQETERLLSLINELLDIEKLEAGMLELSMKKTELSTILSRAVSAVSGLAESSEIKIDYPSTEIELECDEDRIVQVLVNILSNALKVSSPKSSISISIVPRETDFDLRVTDCGPGIAPEDLSRIFDRFQQADVKGKRLSGSGLGLAICRALIQGHKGELGVESELGKGSTFWFRLNCLSEPSA